MLTDNPYRSLRPNDRVRIRLDGGGTLTLTIDELRPPDTGTAAGYGAWAYAKDGRCYWLDTEDGHAYNGQDAARILGHAGRF